MIEVSLKTDFTRLERLLMIGAGRKQLNYAAARALNDCARAASRQINAEMPSIFDRPTRFTERATVAPRELAASPSKLSATVTLRPIQAKYLRPEQEGGERTAAENTRKPGAALVLPGVAMTLDAYGNIPNGALAALRKMVRPGARRRKGGQSAVAAATFFLAPSAPANKAGIGGYFRRTDNGITRLTVFEGATHYRPRFDYFTRVGAVIGPLWPQAMLRRLREAIETAH